MTSEEFQQIIRKWGRRCQQRLKRISHNSGEEFSRFFFRPFAMSKARTTFLILLSGFTAVGLILPSSTAEIYKYVDKDGAVHLTNMPIQAGTDFEGCYTAIWKAAERYRVNYALVKAVIKTESNFNPQAVSPAGARGLMQLMPATADALGIDDSFHPEENIHGGVRHLRYLLDLFNGDLRLALAAYNAGERVVFRYKGIPPYRETRMYVQRVLRNFQDYSSEPKEPDSF